MLFSLLDGRIGGRDLWYWGIELLAGSNTLGTERIEACPDPDGPAPGFATLAEL